MIEQVSKEQTEAAQNALKQNTELLLQKANVTAAETMKLAKDTLDELNATLSEAPYKVEQTIIEIRDKLMTLIYGEPINPESFNYDAILKLTIEQLKQLIIPVVSGLAAISISLPPSLVDLISILTQLESINLPTSGDIKKTATASADSYKSQIAKLVNTTVTDAKDAVNQSGSTAESTVNDIKNSIPDIKPELDPKLKQAISDIQASMITLSYQLPTLVVDLIVQMLSNIYDMFIEIAMAIGVPSIIPPPFSLIKTVPTVLTAVYALIKNLPGKMKNITESIARSKMAEIQALKNSVPPAPMSLCAEGKAVAAVSSTPLEPRKPEEDKEVKHWSGIDI